MLPALAAPLQESRSRTQGGQATRFRSLPRLRLETSRQPHRAPPQQAQRFVVTSVCAHIFNIRRSEVFTDTIECQNTRVQNSQQLSICVAGRPPPSCIAPRRSSGRDDCVEAEAQWPTLLSWLGAAGLVWEHEHCFEAIAASCRGAGRGCEDGPQCPTAQTATPCGEAGPVCWPDRLLDQLECCDTSAGCMRWLCYLYDHPLSSQTLRGQRPIVTEKAQHPFSTSAPETYVVDGISL